MNTRFLKSLSLLLIIALFVSIVPLAAAQDDQKVKLVLSIGPRGFGDVAEGHIARCEAELGNIKVEWQKISDVPNESRSIYVTNFTSRSETPDVLAVDVIWPGDFAARGWIEPLDDYFTQEEIDQYIPEFAAAAVYNDDIYAIPLYIDGTHLFYRTDLLEKYGFEPPQTWEELIEQAQVILEGEDDPDLVGFVSMWAKIEGLFMNWLSFFYGAGGSFFDEDGNLAINSPEGLKALQTMVDMLYEYEIAPESILTFRPDDARILFQQERAVFLMVQDFVIPPLSAEDSPVAGKFDVTQNPVFAGNEGGNSTTIGGFLLAVNAYSNHKEEAADLIRCFTSYESQVDAALISSKAPTRPEVYDDARVVEANPWLPKLGQNFQHGLVRPSAETGAFYPEVSEIMQTEITAALIGEKSPEEALKDAEAQIKALMP